MPKISVIMPCYNQAKYIRESLDSVLAQTFTDYEIIIINDGSTDNSAEIISEYVAKDKRIKVIDQTNQGVVSARNNAIAEAKGTYIFPLDADDKIAETLLEKAYNAIESHKGDIITQRVQYFDRRDGELKLEKPDKYHMAKDDCLVNAALFRKTDFMRSGGYDKAFNKGIEDYDLWLNMLFKLNLKIYRIPEILFYYRYKDVDESRNLQQRQYTKELRKVMFEKYPMMKWYRLLYKFSHFFFDYKDKSQGIYLKLLGISFKIKNKKEIQ